MKPTPPVSLKDTVTALGGYLLTQSPMFVLALLLERRERREKEIK